MKQATAEKVFKNSQNKTKEYLNITRNKTLLPQDSPEKFFQKMWI